MANRYEFKLNGKPVETQANLSSRLIDLIRNEFGLTGTKEGCAEGECGACLVYIDDKMVNSCIMPVGNVVGKNVTTIEGFSQTELYKNIEKAFLENGAVQCGFCTPGMIMASGYIISRFPNPSKETILEYLSGNLCRCTGYDTIVKAVMMASENVGDDR